MDENKLWVLLKRIPKRKVTTYKILAERLDTSPRVVGNVLHKNKDPDNVPCYKVVRSDGSVGGYNLGKKEKIFRLKKDGITIKSDKISNLPDYLFYFQ